MLFIIAKSVPLQFRIGSVMEWLRVYKKVDLHVAQIAMRHWEIVDSVVNRSNLARGKRLVLGMGSVVRYPPVPPLFLHSREWAVKGAMHRRLQWLALDGLLRPCYR